MVIPQYMIPDSYSVRFDWALNKLRTISDRKNLSSIYFSSNIQRLSVCNTLFEIKTELDDYPKDLELERQGVMI